MKKNAVIYCDKCGMAVPGSAEFCPECGCKVSKGKEVWAMIAIGWLFSVLGGILSFIGIALYKSAKSQMYGLYQYYDKSDVNNASILIAIGILVLILGIVLLIFGYLKRKKQFDTIANSLNTRKCLKCGNIVDSSKSYCSKCGNSLKIEKN